MRRKSPFPLGAAEVRAHQKTCLLVPVQFSKNRLRTTAATACRPGAGVATARGSIQTCTIPYFYADRNHFIGPFSGPARNSCPKSPRLAYRDAAKGTAGPYPKRRWPGRFSAITGAPWSALVTLGSTPPVFPGFVIRVHAFTMTSSAARSWWIGGPISRRSPQAETASVRPSPLVGMPRGRFFSLYRGREGPSLFLLHPANALTPV
jgi:hypothetical protein